ncbi:MAG: nitrilase-related carbon-nitrogen hydrolase [Rhodospirillaceae bacterium]|nr:nitrilase-related carbon-nitrogen hydrolase [Rhodospirillaceae bacterium]
MVPIYTAACVQTNVWPVYPKKGGPAELEHKEKNLARAIELIDRVASWNPSKIYVLPEFFMTGAGGVGTTQRDRDIICIRIPGPEIDRLCQLAKRVDAYIAGMAWEVMDDWPDRYWNTAFIISPAGKVILKYHKHYDFTGKTKPGDVMTEYVDRYGVDALWPVADTPLGRMGCLVCFDINIPENARCLALNGAEIILHPTSEGRAPFLMEDVGGWEIGKRSRAYENLCYVISANQGLFLGSDFPTDRMRGRSQIIDYAGRVVTIAETTGECILQADIHIEQLRQKRAQVQMNFLNELQTHVHAVQYARKSLWPKELWKSAPTGGDLGNIKAARENIARLQNEGLFVPPATGQDKKSFV